MKKLSLLILITTIFLIGTLQTSQAQNATFNNFANNIKSGNSSKLPSYLSNTVSINLDGKSSTLNKNQTTDKFQSFLKKYPCKNFEISHTGDSGGSYFATGKYHHNSGSFRVKLLAKQENGAWRISKVDIK